MKFVIINANNAAIKQIPVLLVREMITDVPHQMQGNALVWKVIMTTISPNYVKSNLFFFYFRK